MRSKTIATFTVILCLLVFGPAVLATPQSEACKLPPDLQRQISTKYPGSRIVTLTDLGDDDKEFFTKDHGSACPGVVSVDFYGDGKPTLALALITGAGEKQRTDLLMVRQLGIQWKTARIETTNGPTPVIWRQEPGTYTDIENGKVIRATKPVVVFCHYEAWAIVYAWTVSRIDKVWLLD